MSDDLTGEQVLDTIDRTVNETLGRNGLTAPPVDAVTIAQTEFGISIQLDRDTPGRRRTRHAAGPHSVWLPTDTSEEGRHWVAAQEIGRTLKSALMERAGFDPAEMQCLPGASITKVFAARLLVPTHWFREDAPSYDYDLVQLKERYRTASHETIARRFLDLSDPCIVTVVQDDAIVRRRSNAWRVRRSLERPEQECLSRVRDTGKPQRVSEGGWTVHGWPVHGWPVYHEDRSRQILRSVRDADD